MALSRTGSCGSWGFQTGPYHGRAGRVDCAGFTEVSTRSALVSLRSRQVPGRGSRLRPGALSSVTSRQPGSGDCLRPCPTRVGGHRPEDRRATATGSASIMLRRSWPAIATMSGWHPGHDVSADPPRRLPAVRGKVLRESDREGRSGWTCSILPRSTPCSFADRPGDRLAGKRLAEALEIYRDPAFSRSRVELLFLDLVKQAGIPRPAMNFFVAGHEIDAYWKRSDSRSKSTAGTRTGRERRSRPTRSARRTSSSPASTRSGSPPAASNANRMSSGNGCRSSSPHAGFSQTKDQTPG